MGDSKSGRLIVTLMTSPGLKVSSAWMRSPSLLILKSLILMMISPISIRPVKKEEEESEGSSGMNVRSHVRQTQ